MTTEQNQEVAKINPLLAAESFEDVLRIAGGMDKIVHGGDVVGDGFSVLEDKTRLVKTPFILLDWTLRTDEETGRDYYSLRVITKTQERLVVNDGGTGIPAQIEQMESEGVASGPVFFNGLRKSEYTKEIDGKKQKAVTFYFDTSK